MKSANEHPDWSVESNLLETDQRDFLGNIESLLMTASSRINSHTDLNRNHHNSSTSFVVITLRLLHDNCDLS